MLLISASIPCRVEFTGKLEEMSGGEGRHLDAECAPGNAPQRLGLLLPRHTSTNLKEAATGCIKSKIAIGSAAWCRVRIPLLRPSIGVVRRRYAGRLRAVDR